MRLVRVVKSLRAIRMVRTLRLFRGLNLLVKACQFLGQRVSRRRAYAEFFRKKEFVLGKSSRMRGQPRCFLPSLGWSMVLLVAWGFM